MQWSKFTKHRIFQVLLKSVVVRQCYSKKLEHVKFSLKHSYLDTSKHRSSLTVNMSIRCCWRAGKIESDKEMPLVTALSRIPTSPATPRPIYKSKRCPFTIDSLTDCPSHGSTYSYRSSPVWRRTQFVALYMKCHQETLHS